MRRREREVVEPDEIRDIIEACKVCRLGFCEEGEVYIVPVNFGYDMKGKELTLYIHCAGAVSYTHLDVYKRQDFCPFCGNVR